MSIEIQDLPEESQQKIKRVKENNASSSAVRRTIAKEKLKAASTTQEEVDVLKDFLNLE